jgi:geranylgeranyl reductase family protein
LSTTFKADVAIVGAGPAGAACALALKNSGLRIAWIDKSAFPRDKVCGDAIPSNVQRVLQTIDPTLNQNFLQHFTQKEVIEGCRFVAPDLSSFDLTFATKGHAAQRIHFDHFMFDMAMQSNALITPYLNAEIQHIDAAEQETILRLNNNVAIHAAMVIGCDGANSLIRKKLAPPFIRKHENIAAVRAYYHNISELSHQLLEIHLVKGYMPGYFWIFPLPDNQANVGFGMVNKHIAAHHVDLKQAMNQIISSPRFKHRFANATTDGRMVGYGLPCGGRNNPISGHRFLLCGDAASLINPATGEGIGNAMISGMLAAQHLITCFNEQKFHAAFNQQYDKAVYQRLLADLRMQRWLQHLTSNRAWLVNAALKLVSRNEFIRNRVRRFF